MSDDADPEGDKSRMIAEEGNKRRARAEAAKAALPPTESISAIYIDEKGKTYDVVATKRGNTTRILIPTGVLGPNGNNSPSGSSEPPSGVTGTAFSIKLSFDEFKKRLPAFPMASGEVPGHFMPKSGGGRRRTHRKSRARKTRRSRK